MDEIIDLGDEFNFVYSFASAEHVFEYLEELHAEYHLTDITDIKRAFLNYEMHFHYMECIRFEETYLT